MSTEVVITGTGLYTPPDAISNEELVQSYNRYVDDYNTTHSKEIAAQTLTALPHSSASFIEKASGIKNRFAIDKKGILDPKRMRPYLAPRRDDEPSIQSEMACYAIEQALDKAQKSPQDIDGLIVSCVTQQRAYPSIAIEIQHALGTTGYAYDMIGGCSSATFGLTAAANAIRAKQNHCMVVVNPEIASGQVNYRDRDSHFIFSDACTATVIEHTESATVPGFEVLGYELTTQFSNNIRNNAGYLNHAEVGDNDPTPRYFFTQNGRKVFKEVVPMVEEHILKHLASMSLDKNDIKRYWLHQANINMNELIIKRILGQEPQPLQAPTILDKYGNTTSCGSLIAFQHYSDDFKKGDLGVICSFGAGYSICSLIVRKQ